MERVKLKHFARPDMVSDPDWEQGMEVAVKYIAKKISRLNHCGALDDSVFGMPAAEHFVFAAFDKLFTGQWEWSAHRTIHTQLVKIALSDISHHLRDWKKQQHVQMEELDERVADRYGGINSKAVYLSPNATLTSIGSQTAYAGGGTQQSSGGSGSGTQSGGSSSGTGSGTGSGSGSGTGGSSETPTVAAPTISGTTLFEESTSVTMSGPAGATIHYTTDGSTPTSASTAYSEAIPLSATTTVKAIAIKDGVSSTVTTRTYTKGDPGNGDN